MESTGPKEGARRGSARCDRDSQSPKTIASTAVKKDISTKIVIQRTSVPSVLIAESSVMSRKTARLTH